MKNESEKVSSTKVMIMTMMTLETNPPKLQPAIQIYGIRRGMEKGEGRQRRTKEEKKGRKFNEHAANFTNNGFASPTLHPRPKNTA